METLLSISSIINGYSTHYNTKDIVLWLNYSFGFQAITLFIKACILLIICHWCISQMQRSSAAVRHLTWLCFFIALALLPIAESIFPSVSLSLFSKPVAVNQSNYIVVVSIIIYGLIVSYKLIKLITGLFYLTRINRHACYLFDLNIESPFINKSSNINSNNKRPINDTAKKIKVYASSEIQTAITWGRF